MTNREDLANMSNKELAMWLSKIMVCCSSCDDSIRKYCDNEERNKHYDPCSDIIQRWLEREVEK